MLYFSHKMHLNTGRFSYDTPKHLTPLPYSFLQDLPTQATEKKAHFHPRISPGHLDLAAIMTIRQTSHTLTRLQFSHATVYTHTHTDTDIRSLHFFVIRPPLLAHTFDYLDMQMTQDQTSPPARSILARSRASHISLG